MKRQCPWFQMKDSSGLWFVDGLYSMMLANSCDCLNVHAAVIQLLVLPKIEKTLVYAAWSGKVTFMVNVAGWWIALDCEKNIFDLDGSLLDLWGHFRICGCMMLILQHLIFCSSFSH